VQMLTGLGARLTVAIELTALENRSVGRTLQEYALGAAGLLTLGLLAVLATVALLPGQVPAAEPAVDVDWRVHARCHERVPFRWTAVRQSAVGAIAYSFMPILTTGFAVLLLSTASLDLVDALGIFLGFVGVGIVAQPSIAAIHADRLIGFGLMIGSVAIFALGTVLTQRVQPALPRLALTAWAVLLAAVVNHGIAGVFGHSLTEITWTSAAIAGVLITSLLATAVLYAVHFELIDRIGPARTSLNFYLQPIVAAPLGLILFDNRLTTVSLAGFLVIFVGFVLIERQVILDTGLSAS